MISDARGGHVSPGIYTEEKDVTYSAKSLGITSLGLVGETVKGPAFQPIAIEDWSEFVDYFGGTSPERFKGTNLPKYELPYIAKSYLQESKRLNVVRVLGLSGYKTSPAYVINVKVGDNGKTQPLVILRSKGDYSGELTGAKKCGNATQEMFNPYVEEVELGQYEAHEYAADCSVSSSAATIALSGTVIVSGDGKHKAVDSTSTAKDNELGRFSLKVTYKTGKINVVYKYEDVTPTDEEKNKAKEEKEVPKTVSADSTELIKVGEKYYKRKETSEAETTATTYNISLRPTDRDYIYNVFSSDPLVGTAPLFIEAVYDYAYKEMIAKAENNTPVTFSLNVPCIVTYSYSEIKKEEIPQDKTAKDVDKLPESENVNKNSDEYIKVDTKYYKLTEDIKYTEIDFQEPYRTAQTPWIVSEVKNATNTAINLKKLFKVYTISDGNASNYQVKISIQKIRPDDGLFDLWVRDYYDTDVNPIVLEKFSNLSMVEGDSNYIGLKIGTVDGGYVAKSKYISVLISNEDGVESCVPCGFLGYPMPNYDCGKRIDLAYNTQWDDTVKSKRQYFGLNSDILDEDVLNYKGVNAYNNAKYDADPTILTNGFHLDSIIEAKSGETGCIVYVDSETGYKFTTVNPVQNAGTYTAIPRLFNENYADDTIYSDINLRKFTVYPYGGFDGWDIYRNFRTNIDKYKASKYAIVEGCPFTTVGNEIATDMQVDLNLTTAITSDYYAYLAGYRQFANPQDVEINVFATPGIDYHNNNLLVEDALDMIEDQEDGRGGDAIYIINSPMSEFSVGTNGLAVHLNDITEADEEVEKLEDSEIVSSYACTYWPWVKYYDTDYKTYIDLPVTKDVVRNMAKTDNNSYPWFAPAGVERGSVDCTKAYLKTTLSDEDTLYEGRINPIKSFSVDGVKVWGNKTLYTKDTPLNRINVRRLMLRIKKLVIDASKSLIFEQYDASLEKQFRSLIEPILSDVKSNRGISDYRLVTECTAETRDQHILPAKILVKPTPALEYISISFTVYPESVEFDESV